MQCRTAPPAAAAAPPTTRCAAAAAAARCLPCPAVAPDEPHQRGDSNLLKSHSLENIANHVLSGRLLPGDYQSKLSCLTDWRRRGTAYDLAPLANQLPSSNPPDFKPLPRDALDRAFSLQPGGYRLTEVRKCGVCVPGSLPGVPGGQGGRCAFR